MTPELRQECIEVLTEMLEALDELRDDESIYIGVDLERADRLLQELKS